MVLLSPASVRKGRVCRANKSGWSIFVLDDFLTGAYSNSGKMGGASSGSAFWCRLPRIVGYHEPGDGKSFDGSARMNDLNMTRAGSTM